MGRLVIRAEVMNRDRNAVILQVDRFCFFVRSAHLAVRVIGSGLLRLEFIKTTVECPDVSNKRMRGRERWRQGRREGTAGKM